MLGDRSCHNDLTRLVLELQEVVPELPRITRDSDRKDFASK